MLKLSNSGNLFQKPGFPFNRQTFPVAVGNNFFIVFNGFVDIYPYHFHAVGNFIIFKAVLPSRLWISECWLVRSIFILALKKRAIVSEFQ